MVVCPVFYRIFIAIYLFVFPEEATTIPNQFKFGHLNRFQTRNRLALEHSVTSRSEQKSIYRCDICRQIFAKSHEFRKHYLASHINPKYLSSRDKQLCGSVSASNTEIDHHETPQPGCDKRTFFQTFDLLKVEAIGTARSIAECADKTCSQHSCHQCHCAGVVQAEGEKVLNVNAKEQQSSTDSSSKPKLEDVEIDVYRCHLCFSDGAVVTGRTAGELRCHLFDMHNGQMLKLLQENSGAHLELICEACDSIFPSKAQLKQHISLCHSHVCKCPHCSKVISNAGDSTRTNQRLSLLDHIKTEHPDLFHPCHFCSMYLSCTKDLEEHLRFTHHKTIDENVREEKLHELNYFLFNHSRVPPGEVVPDGVPVAESMYVCLTCGERCHTWRQTRMHKYHVHMRRWPKNKCPSISNLIKNFGVSKQELSKILEELDFDVEQNVSKNIVCFLDGKYRRVRYATSLLHTKLRLALLKQKRGGTSGTREQKASPRIQYKLYNFSKNFTTKPNKTKEDIDPDAWAKQHQLKCVKCEKVFFDEWLYDRHKRNCRIKLNVVTEEAKSEDTSGAEDVDSENKDDVPVKRARLVRNSDGRMVRQLEEAVPSPAPSSPLVDMESLSQQDSSDVDHNQSTSCFTRDPILTNTYVCAACLRRFLGYKRLLSHQIKAHPYIFCIPMLHYELNEPDMPDIKPVFLPKPCVYGKLPESWNNISHPPRHPKKGYFTCSKCSEQFGTISRLHFHVMGCGTEGEEYKDWWEQQPENIRKKKRKRPATRLFKKSRGCITADRLKQKAMGRNKKFTGVIPQTNDGHRKSGMESQTVTDRHQSRESVIPASSVTPYQFKCPLCSKYFRTFDSLVAHRKDQHTLGRKCAMHSCTCGRSFKRSSRLNEHQKICVNVKNATGKMKNVIENGEDLVQTAITKLEKLTINGLRSSKHLLLGATQLIDNAGRGKIAKPKCTKEVNGRLKQKNGSCNTKKQMPNKTNQKKVEVGSCKKGKVVLPSNVKQITSQTSNTTDSETIRGKSKRRNLKGKGQRKAEKIKSKTFSTAGEVTEPRPCGDVSLTIEEGDEQRKVFEKLPKERKALTKRGEPKNVCQKMSKNRAKVVGKMVKRKKCSKNNVKFLLCNKPGDLSLLVSLPLSQLRLPSSVLNKSVINKLSTGNKLDPYEFQEDKGPVINGIIYPNHIRHFEQDGDKTVHHVLTDSQQIENNANCSNNLTVASGTDDSLSKNSGKHSLPPVNYESTGAADGLPRSPSPPTTPFLHINSGSW